MKKTRYTKEFLLPLVATSTSMSDLLKIIGIRTAGGNYNNIRRHIEINNISTDHYKEYQKIKLDKLHLKLLIPLAEVLVKGRATNGSNLKRRLYSLGLKTPLCELCGQGELWNGKKMSLILDHINGHHDDNRLENLRIVCPNCNATLDTHCNKNRSKKWNKLQELGFDGASNLDLRKVRRTTNIFTEKEKNYYLSKRKVVRPPLDQLELEIQNFGYRGTGKIYGVSDVAIRKWVETYKKIGI